MYSVFPFSYGLCAASLVEYFLGMDFKNKEKINYVFIHQIIVLHNQ